MSLEGLTKAFSVPLLEEQAEGNADMWSGAFALTTDLYRATHVNEPWPLPGFILTFIYHSQKEQKSPFDFHLTFLLQVWFFSHICKGLLM